MKPRVRLGSGSAAVVPAASALALAALAALATGCSSSSSSETPTPDGGTSGGADGAVADAGQPIIDGSGMACTPNAHETVASKVTLKVNWPVTLANAGCLQSSTPPCSGDINIWLLTQYDISGSNVTGTTYTCANDTPSIPLTALGSQSEGLPAGTQAKVLIQFDPSVWTNILHAQMAGTIPPTATTGVIGGWNVGSSFTINATNSTYGLKASSPLTSASMPWPASQSSIPATDISDDDNDGHPGITATPSGTNGNSLPATALQTSAPFAPQADKLYLTLRTELSLYGTSSTCTDISGSAEALLMNNHVIGCHVVGGGDCTSDQWNFIDSNSTVYVGPGVKIPVGTPAPTFAPPQIHGTFNAKILSTDPDAGSTIDCAAVMAAMP